MKAKFCLPYGITLVFMFAASVWSAGQSSFSLIHTFNNNPDGRLPSAQLTADSKGNLYGTTQFGGAFGYGSVFELSPDGNGGWKYEQIYSLLGGSDGAFPVGPVTVDDQGNLYGSDVLDDVYGYGAVFELSRGGVSGTWSLTRTYNFDNSFGGKPMAGVLVDANGNVFGATHSNFGVTGDIYGAIFELTPTASGWSEQTLYEFPSDGSQGGYADVGRLIMDDSGNLYGMTLYGGSAFNGTVFQLHPTGGRWVLTTLHNFAGAPSDGAMAKGDLTLRNRKLYGATIQGGPINNYGGVFALGQTNGQWQISWLYFFTGGSDGGNPAGGVVFDQAGNIYGAAGGGGIVSDCYGIGCGALFKLTPSGTTWTESVLYDFTGKRDGNGPNAPPLFDNAGNLYGTTGYAGKATCDPALGCGTVFELKKP